MNIYLISIRIILISFNSFCQQFRFDTSDFNMEHKIVSVSKPFLTFATILGLFPMKFEGTLQKGCWKLSITGVICSFCSISALLYLTWSTMAFAKLYINPSVLLGKAWNITKGFETFSLFYQFAYQLLKCNKIMEFLKRVGDLDNDVS